MQTNMRGRFALALAVLLSACASSGPVEGAAASSTSIKNSCINPTEITKQTIVSNEEIQFELRNGQTWVNQLPRACPGLKFQQGFTWDVRGALVCSNQQAIKVKDEGTRCMLGEFARVSG